MRKFTLPAGTTNRHQWHKPAVKAVEGVTRTFDMMREKWGTLGGDEHESLVTILHFGADDPKNPEAVTLYEEIGERFGWVINKVNAAQVAEAFTDALPKCMETVPVDDNRTTPEQNAERAELQQQQSAERETKAAEKANTVEVLAAELRKQYPNAIGADSGKSSHARAAANLKQILQAQGLRASVKSSSFSMGNSVTARVLTPDLPPEQRKEIDAICNLFTYGTFDPMTDSSGYDHSDEGEAWELVHGRAKYCRAEYEQSEECKAAIVEYLGQTGEPDDGYGGSMAYRVWTGVTCPEFWDKWAEDHKPDPTGPFQVSGVYSIDKHHHTKRGFDFWLVVLADRVERDEFNRLRSSCKAAGGWYSRKWAGTPGGFAFTEQERAATWALQEFAPDFTPPDPKRSRDHEHEWKPTGTNKKRAATAEKFRTMAEKLDDEVMAKRGDHQENTPKRQREAMSRRIDADRLERTAQGLRALADLHEAGEVPELLAKFTSKKAIFEALGVRTVSNGYYHVAPTDERSDTSPPAVALWGLLDGKDPEQEKADRLAEMLAGLPKLPGYFPTPQAVAYDMVSEAGITAAHTVLEPSAGSGAILDEIADLHHEPVAVVVYEINPTLCEVLQAKGYDARPLDFLEQEPGSVRYDRVLMNPPFEKMQDVEHVRHAFDFLKPGGRLVAIMSPSAFFRDTAKAREFREWFEDLGGTVEEVEAGAFKESGTGVASRLVVIDKPEEVRKVTPQVKALPGMTPLGGPLCKEQPHLGNISNESAEWLAGEIKEQSSLF